jgi:hypothetical protein
MNIDTMISALSDTVARLEVGPPQAEVNVPGILDAVVLRIEKMLAQVALRDVVHGLQDKIATLEVTL